MDQLAFDSLIRRRGGVVTRAHLRALGLSDDTISRQVGRQLWRDAGPGILVHHTAAPGLLTDTRVAALWRPDAILTGPSAAILRPNEAWRDEHLPERAMIVAPRSGRGPWRTVRHPGAGFVRLEGAKVADRTTTVVDLLRFLPRRQGLAIGAAAIRGSVTTVAALEASVSRLSSAAGVAQLRGIVADLSAGAHSVGEVDLQKALRSAGIAGWQANYWVTARGQAFCLDIAFPAERVYLEYDGIDPHTGDRAFVGDRDRQNLLIAEGWDPIRVTWEALWFDRAKLIELIRDTLAIGRRRAA